MGLFDKKEKLLESEIYTLRDNLKSLDLDNATLSKELKKLTVVNRELRDLNEKHKNTISKFEQRLIDKEDLPEKNVAVISLIVRFLGATLLLASIAFACYLALGVESGKSYHIILVLYITTQFIGMYLLGFGAHTTLRSLSILGCYMTAVTAISTLSIVLSVIKYTAVLSLDRLILLAAINVLGVPLLLYIEWRRILNSRLKN